MMRSSLLGLLLILTSPLAYGFPEMVRHDYVNCTTCHVAQNGGGILTEYGRALSLEVLTTWGKEGEEQFLYGVVKPPKWLNLGGDIRAVQTYINNAFIERGDFITMQMDLEAAITFTEQLRFVGTIGKKYIPTGNPSFGDYLISRRHFLSYQHNDQISLRAENSSSLTESIFPITSSKLSEVSSGTMIPKRTTSKVHTSPKTGISS